MGQSPQWQIVFPFGIPRGPSLAGILSSLLLGGVFVWVIPVILWTHAKNSIYLKDAHFEIGCHFPHATSLHSCLTLLQWGRKCTRKIENRSILCRQHQLLFIKKVEETCKVINFLAIFRIDGFKCIEGIKGSKKLILIRQFSSQFRQWIIGLCLIIHHDLDNTQNVNTATKLNKILNPSMKLKISWKFVEDYYIIRPVDFGQRWHWITRAVSKIPF